MAHLENLVSQTDGEIIVKGLHSDDFDEEFEYHISRRFFSIKLVSSEVTLLTVNPDGNGIKWENSRFYYG